jgi:diguanylate cyclase (GGDEF)-like protein/PAS domain S-box-containing protein
VTLPGEQRQLLDQVSSVVYTARPGPDGEWLSVSAGIERLLGWSPDEWLAQPGLWQSRLHPDDRDGVAEARGRLRETGATVLEYRLVARDGQVRWVMDDAALIQSAPGGEPAVGGVIVDVTRWRTVAAERERAEREHDTRAAQQAAVAALGRRALAGAGLQELIEEAAAIVARFLEVEVAGIFELLPGGEEALLRAGVGWRRGRVGRAVVRTAAVAELQTALQVPLLAELGVQSALRVTIGPEPDSFGALVACPRDEREFSEHDIYFMRSLANVIGAAVQRARDNTALIKHAIEDSVTGLPNRRLFFDRLRQAAHRRENAGGFAVYFVDVDDFRDVNSQAGSSGGDQLLAELGARLRRALRPADTVARFGGDEFAILCEGIDSETDALAVAARLADTLDDPFRLDAETLAVTASMGIALSGVPNSRPEAVVHRANEAMFRAKASGGGRCELSYEESCTAADVGS